MWFASPPKLGAAEFLLLNFFGHKKRRVKKNTWMTFRQVPGNYNNKRYTELSGELVFGCLHFIASSSNYFFVRANFPYPRQKPALSQNLYSYMPARPVSNPSKIWLNKAIPQVKSLWRIAGGVVC